MKETRGFDHSLANYIRTYRTEKATDGLTANANIEIDGKTNFYISGCTYKWEIFTKNSTI